MMLRYEWRELTPDGLLKEPSEVGPHYDRESVNGYAGNYTSRESAETAPNQFAIRHDWHGELVLVEFHVVSR